VIEHSSVRLIECVDPITSVDEALGVIAACVGHASQRVLID
jgi:hypothetical protein